MTPREYIRLRLECYAEQHKFGGRYPETRVKVSEFHPAVRVVLRVLCGVFTGHESSPPEWTYAGGSVTHNWCRWCGKYYLTIIEKGK